MNRHEFTPAQAYCHGCSTVLEASAKFCHMCGLARGGVKAVSNISRLIVAGATLGWLFLTLLVFSEPSPSILLFVLEFYTVVGLVLSWLFLLLPGAYRSLRAYGGAGLKYATSVLAPLPMATAVLVLALIYQLPLMARLELSESALIAHAERVDAGHDDGYHIWRFIGLFKVSEVYERDGCIIFVTDAFGPDDEGGLAYCTGKLPCGPTVEMRHIKGQWWTWNYWETSERC